MARSRKRDDTKDNDTIVMAKLAEIGNLSRIKNSNSFYLYENIRNKTYIIIIIFFQPKKLLIK